MTNGFDKLLRESLTADAAADTGAECLDAAVVAGWFDGTLSHAERTAVEAHAATCSRCQATIAALVRTDRPIARAWWRAPAVRWLVPIAVAGAACARCLDRRAPHGRCRSAAVGNLRAARICRKGSGSRARIGRSGPRLLLAGRRGSCRCAPRRRRPAAGARENAPDSARRDRDAKAGAPECSSAVEVPALPDRAAAAAGRHRRTAAAGARATRARASPAPPPAAKADAGAAPALCRASRMRPAIDGCDATVCGAQPSPNRPTPAAGRGGGRAPLIQSPDRSVRWRITGQSQVERSVDGGLTWQTQTTGVNAVLIAGIAPSSNVCWLVGWRGVVLKTTDGGQTWTRVAFPEEIDLMAVVADDDKVATRHRRRRQAAAHDRRGMRVRATCSSSTARHADHVPGEPGCRTSHVSLT